MYNVINNTVLWTTESKNEFGQVTRYHTGDGVTTERAYDPLTGRLSGIVSWKGNDTIQNLTYVFDKNANLASRKDSIRNMEERFIYDRLDRLIGIVEGNDTTGVFVYDDYGRMTMKRIHGSLVFDNTTYGADRRPHALEQARVYNERPEQSISYTSFDKLRTIQQNGTLHFDEAWLRYDYGYDHQRLRMTEAILLDSIEKEYVGSCEFVKTNGVTTSELTFLSGPLGVFAVIDSHVQPVGKGMYYVHPDHLGSWTTITNRNGMVVQDVHFDPWGTPYYSDAVTPTVATSLLFDRGFTGHEHMMVFGLINMNGRVYDPVTSTFLSVDNYVQDPSSTQSFNRYAYCMNNPLKYVDPSGNFLTWCFNHLGFSLGINLTPIGIPIGFGINVSWGNGGSVGVYGEVAYRTGGTGFGFGAGFQQSLDYSLKYNSLSTTSSANAYYSFGCITVGGSVSYNYNMTYKQGIFGWNVGVGAAWNPNMPYSSYGQSMGIGLGVSYGSSGFNYGINGYYQGLSLQDKLDILVDRYKAEMTKAIGDADPQVFVGSNANFRKNGVAAHNSYGDIWDETNNVRANGLTEQGNVLGLVEFDGRSYASFDSDVYISKNTIRKMWRGSEYGKRTLFHEWVHAHDYYSGQASYWLSQLQDNFALRVWMENNAYDFVNNYFPNLPPTTFHP